MADETVNVGLGMGEPENVPQLQLGAAQEQDVPAIELSIEVPDTVYAKRSEAWAIGTINGEPVPETDPAYHNNSRYYAIQSAVEDAIDDTAGEGDTDKVWSADKTYTEISGLGEDIAEAVAEVEEKLTGKAPVIENTASGAIASFPDGADNLPVKTLTVGIEPVQDLHGYDNPWPAGGGKNRISLASLTLGGTEARTKRIEIDAIPAGTYVFTATNTGTETSTALYGLQFFDAVTGGSNVGHAQNGLTFTLTGEAISVYFYMDLDSYSDGKTVILSDMMIRLSSVSDATFAPYSNICPISGWTGAEVTRMGKNLLDWQITESYFDINFNGFGNNKWQNRITIPEAWYGKTITYSAHVVATSKGNQAVRVWFYKDGQLVGTFMTGNIVSAYSEGDSVVTVTMPSKDEANQVAFGVMAYMSTFSNPQIELGPTATVYEPYKGNVYDISFPSSAGTVYGGTLTVHQDGTGTLVVTHKMWTADGNTTWEIAGEGTADVSFYSQSGYGFDAKVYDDNGYSNYFKYKYSFNASGGIMAYTNRININKGSGFTSVAELQTAFAQNPLQLLYPIATPVTYELSNLEVIATLKGSNNIWADTGNTTAEYPADTKLYIDGKIAELQALILENINNA